MSSDAVRKKIDDLPLPIDGSSDAGDQKFDKDLSKLLERNHFGEYSYGRSFPSKGVFSVSIPDPINPRAEFVYNYFTPNERAFLEPDPSGILYNSQLFDEDDIHFIARAEQTPRYVKLDFDTPKMKDVESTQNLDFQSQEVGLNNSDVEDFFMGSFEDLGENVKLKDIVEKINIEGASSNFNFSGVEIIDTFADKKIYKTLSASITFQEVSSPLDSPRERAAAFRDKISRNDTNTPNPVGLDKLVLIDILTETQPAGISLAPHDVEEDDAQLATDPITKQSFSVKFNNLFFGDIITHNTQTMNTIYEDELRGLKEVAMNAQEQAISDATPGIINDHDHHMNIEPISLQEISIPGQLIEETKSQLRAQVNSINSFLEVLESLNTSPPASARDYLKLYITALNKGIADPTDYILNSHYDVPNMKVIGYLIQKSEILADGTTQDFPNLFIDNPKEFSTFIDPEVRYGAVYNYRIRTIALVKSCIGVFNAADNTKKVMIAEYLMLSDGKNISAECVENIPPPAPVRINAYIDFKYRVPVLTWEFPLNKQRDIKRFQIFKRQEKRREDGTIIPAIDQPFTLVAEYDFDNSVYRTIPNEVAEEKNLYRLNIPYKKFRDKEFNLNFDKAIYAVAAVDAHGLSSGYSAQIMLSYDKYTNRLMKEVVSYRSAPKPYPNLYISEDFFKDIITSSGRKRCNVYFDPEYYKLYKKVKDKDGNVEGQKDLEYIRTSDTEYNYIFQLINLDLQEQQKIKIKIADRSGRNISVPAAKISPTNLNFEFGVKD